jgi:hypothetical protein
MAEFGKNDEPRIILEDPKCPTCGAWASAILEPCVKVIPLVQEGERFIEDHGMVDVEPVGDETDDIRVECPNAHYWMTREIGAS